MKGRIWAQRGACYSNLKEMVSRAAARWQRQDQLEQPSRWHHRYPGSSVKINKIGKKKQRETTSGRKKMKTHKAPRPAVPNANISFFLYIATMYIREHSPFHCCFALHFISLFFCFFLFLIKKYANNDAITRPNDLCCRSTENWPVSVCRVWAKWKPGMGLFSNAWKTKEMPSHR